MQPGDFSQLTASLKELEHPGLKPPEWQSLSSESLKRLSPFLWSALTIDGLRMQLPTNRSLAGSKRSIDAECLIYSCPTERRYCSKELARSTPLRVATG